MLRIAVANFHEIWNSESMGNRITDIGKRKSMVAGENLLRTAGFKKTAKLGTEKNPARVHVRTEQRAKELALLFKEKGWHGRIELEPDKPENRMKQGQIFTIDFAPG
jgi:hypothetical protein